MNDRLAAGRWLKFENPKPDAQKNLVAFLGHPAASLCWPRDLCTMDHVYAKIERLNSLRSGSG